MRDKERGVVWEETMILLPHNVHYVFLSATIPNALQFARWIAELHKQPCHVVYTEYVLILFSLSLYLFMVNWMSCPFRAPIRYYSPLLFWIVAANP